MPLLTRYEPPKATQPGPVRLSAYQNRLFEMIEQGGQAAIEASRMLLIDKRTLGSFLVGRKRSRNYLAVSRRGIFRLTPLGKQARAAWREANIFVSKPVDHFPQSWQDQIEALSGIFKMPPKRESNVHSIQHHKNKKTA